jgi:hypothetical protein
MARRTHRSKSAAAAKSQMARGRRRLSAASVAIAVFLLAGTYVLLAATNGWPPFADGSGRPGVSLVPSRTGIPLPPGAGSVAIFQPAPTATGNSEASPDVFACVDKLYVNNDVLQPMRRDLDYQIWRNPDYHGEKSVPRYLFRLRQQILQSNDASRMITEIRACTGLE